MREGKIINVNRRMFAIFIGRLRTIMARLSAIIGILIAKAKTDRPRQKYGGEHYRHKISGTMHSSSNGFYNHHLIKLYHNHCRKWQIILKEPQRGRKSSLALRLRSLSSSNAEGITLEISGRKRRNVSGFDCVLENENLVRKILEVPKWHGEV